LKGNRVRGVVGEEKSEWETARPRSMKIGTRPSFGFSKREASQCTGLRVYAVVEWPKFLSQAAVRVSLSKGRDGEEKGFEAFQDCSRVD
jgi:hypothetical protein